MTKRAERARRMDVLQRTEAEFDPIPFGAEAARAERRTSPRLSRLTEAEAGLADLITNQDDSRVERGGAESVHQPPTAALGALTGPLGGTILSPR